MDSLKKVMTTVSPALYEVTRKDRAQKAALDSTTNQETMEANSRTSTEKDIFSGYWRATSTTWSIMNWADSTSDVHFIAMLSRLTISGDGAMNAAGNMVWSTGGAIRILERQE